MLDELQVNSIGDVKLPKALHKPASFCCVTGGVAHPVKACN